jgi:hypothetical protein
MLRPKKVTICSSVSFYKEVIEAKHILSSLGFQVNVPQLAEIMEKKGDFQFQSYSEQFDSANPQVKRGFIEGYFPQLAQADYVLVIN